MPLNDAPTLYAVSAERMVSRQLGGSCEVPLAAHAVWDQQQMQIQSFVASTDGKKICLAKGHAKVDSIADAEALGLDIAKELIAQGAMDLIPKMTK
jgi:hydroxymethylbilane synthase